MKNIFLTLAVVLQISLVAQAGRESHGLLPDYQVRCFNPDGTGTKVDFGIAEKPFYAMVTGSDNQGSEYSCKGNSVLLCTNKKSDLTVQLNRREKPMTALIFQNRRLVEKVPCL